MTSRRIYDLGISKSANKYNDKDLRITRKILEKDFDSLDEDSKEIVQEILGPYGLIDQKKKGVDQ
jgi:hypothetical protein